MTLSAALEPPPLLLSPLPRTRRASSCQLACSSAGAADFRLQGLASQLPPPVEPAAGVSFRERLRSGAGQSSCAASNELSRGEGSVLSLLNNLGGSGLWSGTGTGRQGSKASNAESVERKMFGSSLFRPNANVPPLAASPPAGNVTSQPLASPASGASSPLAVADQLWPLTRTGFHMAALRKLKPCRKRREQTRMSVRLRLQDSLIMESNEDSEEEEEEAPRRTWSSGLAPMRLSSSQSPALPSRRPLLQVATFGRQDVEQVRVCAAAALVLAVHRRARRLLLTLRLACMGVGGCLHSQQDRQGMAHDSYQFPAMHMLFGKNASPSPSAASPLPASSPFAASPAQSPAPPRRFSWDRPAFSQVLLLFASKMRLPLDA